MCVCVGQLTHTLRWLSHVRSRLLDRTHLPLADNVHFFHALLIVSTLGTLIAVYAQIKSLTLFRYAVCTYLALMSSYVAS